MSRIIVFILMWPVVVWSQGKLKKVDTVYVNKEGTVIMFPSSVKNIVAFPGSQDYGAAVKGGSTVFLKAAVEDAKPCRLWIRYDDNDYRTILAYKSYLKEDEMYINLTKVEDIEALSNDSIAITENSISIEKQFMRRRVDEFSAKKKDKYNGIADIDESIVVKFADIMQDDKLYYIKLGVFNESKKEYEIGTVDWFYRNKADSREYKQEFDQAQPVNTKVGPGRGESIIYAVPKFNMGTKWYFEITVSQKNGSRKHVLKVDYEKIDKAEKFK